MSDDLNSQKADEILKKQNIGLGKNKNKFIELYEKLNKITHYDAFFLLNHFNLESEPQVKDFANKFVNSHEKSHSSYRNTAFGVAHSFNLEDSLKKNPGAIYDMVLTNPPFGKKSSETIVTDEGETSKQSLTIIRDDFWTETSNKQLNFLQHVKSILKTTGKAGIVLPDNVLF